MPFKKYIKKWFQWKNSLALWSTRLLMVTLYRSCTKFLIDLILTDIIFFQILPCIKRLFKDQVNAIYELVFVSNVECEWMSTIWLKNYVISAILKTGEVLKSQMLGMCRHFELLLFFNAIQKTYFPDHIRHGCLASVWAGFENSRPSSLCATFSRIHFADLRKWRSNGKTSQALSSFLSPHPHRLFWNENFPQGTHFKWSSKSVVLNLWWFAIRDPQSRVKQVLASQKYLPSTILLRNTGLSHSWVHLKHKEHISFSLFSSIFALTCS